MRKVGRVGSGWRYVCQSGGGVGALAVTIKDAEIDWIQCRESWQEAVDLYKKQRTITKG